jgi:CheY-like chemotaxis protein
MVELLSEDPNLTPEQKEYVNSIQLSAKALLTIVNDVLDFSKIESGRLDIEEVPFNLASIVGELCKLLGMFASQKGLKFSYENTMDKDLELLGDPGRTRQVLSNLLTNALKFTKEGTVHLSVSARPMSPQVIGDEMVEVQFIIEDTGIGIEKHVLDKLFRPFSQGDSSTARLYGGTGLGLTISRNVSNLQSFTVPGANLSKLASLMKGSITLQSTPGIGSKAIFTVPLKVSSYCRNPRLDSSTWSPPHPGFRLSERTSLTLTPTWSQNLAHRSINQDLVNQQISNCVADYPPLPSPPIDRSLRHSSIETLNSSLPLTLSPEQRSKVHVLVVEDKYAPPCPVLSLPHIITLTGKSAINQTIAIKNIRKLGFPVTAVWNGREALSYLLSPSPSQPRPSIILMDVQMPVMDGYEATRILRTGREYSLEDGKGDENKMVEFGRRQDDGEKILIGGRLSDIPVIAMTASAIQGDREKCHEAGMDDYLAKPVEKAKLEEMLVKWANRRRG